MRLKNPFTYIGTKNRKNSHPKRKIFQKNLRAAKKQLSRSEYSVIASVIIGKRIAFPPPPAAPAGHRRCTAPRRREEGVNIGRKQTHPHPGNAEQEEAELPSAHAQGGHQQGRYHAEEDVFNIGHASTALLVAGNSPRIANVSSRSHQKVGLAGEVSGQKQPAVHSRYSAYTKHSMPM